MKNQKESPIKVNPLRTPGQSIDEEIDRLINEVAMSYVVVAMFSVLIAGFEWLRWYLEFSYSPVLFSIVAVTVALIASYKVAKTRKMIRNLRQGRDGEKYVGQYLEQLREKGYHVFHDVINEKGNIDHVIICERGIFTIETKTYSKGYGSGDIVVNGECITINGVDNYKIATQAIAEAKWLSDLFFNSLNKQIFVRPVVVFPGWYVGSKNASKKLWVLNHKGLPKYIANNFEKIPEEDVKRFSDCLAKYIRNK